MTSAAELDARPTTRSIHVLLFALAVLFAGIATFTAPWISAFAFALLVWRGFAARRSLRMPGRAVKAILALAGVLVVLATYRTVNGAEAGSALLMLMIGIKLTEVKRVRDAVFTLVLAWFLVFAALLYSQEIPFVAWMILSGWALVAALLTVTRNAVQPEFMSAFRQSGRYLAQALPFAVILFLLFPRLPGPLWGVPSPNASGVTGLDDSMSPGSISRLAQSDEVAFRVRFDGEPPPPAELYWRGPTLSSFNGRTWLPGVVRFRGQQRPTDLGNAVSYTVMLEPHQRNWMYALTWPASYPEDALLTSEFLLAARRPITQRRSYEVVSFLAHTLDPELSGDHAYWALQMPREGNQRARELAQSWRQEAGNPRDIVQRALAMFRDEEFFYTLEPPLNRGDIVDDFLFRTRSGFCEHYAGAFVFLMRAAGVPARVVTGYLGGELNEYSNYLVVRQSDAHAWAEVWLEGEGWVRVDPTAAISPERILSGFSSVLNEQQTEAGEASGLFYLMVELEMRWEALNVVWNEFFLGFGPETQFNLLASMGMDDPDWQKMVIAMLILMTVLGMLLWAWLWWTHRPLALDPALLLYRRLQRRLARRLGPPRLHEGPEDFYRRVLHDAPEHAALVREFIDAYLASRYLPVPAEARTLAPMKRILRRLKA